MEASQKCAELFERFRKKHYLYTEIKLITVVLKIDIRWRLLCEFASM